MLLVPGMNWFFVFKLRKLSKNRKFSTPDDAQVLAVDDAEEPQIDTMNQMSKGNVKNAILF